MSDGDALLAAILAYPGEDTPRLMYADWLTENRQGERAEFIRVQVELATVQGCAARCRACYPLSRSVRRPACRNAKRRDVLRDREREILPESLNAEVARFFAWNVRPSWGRGFVECVTCPAADWLAHGDAIVWHPSQTVVCEMCQGEPIGACDFGQGTVYPKCVRCDGTGRVPRPCPATAQPVTRVVLTTRLAEHCEYTATKARLPGRGRWVEVVSRNGRIPVIELLETEWPGVAFSFALPPPDVEFDLSVSDPKLARGTGRFADDTLEE